MGGSPYTLPFSTSTIFDTFVDGGVSISSSTIFQLPNGVEFTLAEADVKTQVRYYIVTLVSQYTDEQRAAHTAVFTGILNTVHDIVANMDNHEEKLNQVRGQFNSVVDHLLQSM